MNGRGLYLLAFLIVLGLISYNDITKCKQLPWPPRIVATAIAFGVLDLFSIVSGDLAAVIAIGFVLALVANTLVANNPKLNANASQQINSFFLGCEQIAKGTGQPASVDKALQTIGPTDTLA